MNTQQYLLQLRLKRHVSEYHFLECQLNEMTFAMDCFAEAFREEFHTDIASAAARSLTIHADTGMDTREGGGEGKGEGEVPQEQDGVVKRTTAFNHQLQGGVTQVQTANNSVVPDDPRRLARRLYKRLALVMHPDKINGSAHAFLAVEQAYREGDALKLLSIATQGGVSIDGMYACDNDVANSMAMIKNKIANIKSSIAWAWYDATESDRPQLRILIVETLNRYRCTR